MAGENTLFISYAHRDEIWKDELLVQLRALGRAVPLDIWDDRRIRQGEDWYREIRNAVARARFAVCLITGHFLGSSFCMDEEIPELLRRRQEEGLDLLPILIEDCPWEAHLWLKPLQMLPRDGKTVKVDFRDNHETVFSAVAKRIYEALQGPAVTPAGAPGLPTRPAAAAPNDTQRLPPATSHLFGRHHELQILMDAVNDPDGGIVVLHGWGGVGKTGLVRAWVDALPQHPGASTRPVFAWSFGNQSATDRETSADSFAIAALRFFGDGSPLQGLPWEKGERLAGLVAGRRGILLLDGLEPLQCRDGTLRDPIILSLLRQLSCRCGGLCVVTSRLALADFAEEGDRSGVRHQNVEEISPAVGRALLRSRGVKGHDQELEALVTACGGQALAVELLASCPDVRGKPGAAAKTGPIVGARSEHARRVLALLAQQLGNGAEVGLLRVLALFDGPVGMDELDAVLGPPVLPGATDFLQGAPTTFLFRQIQKLRSQRLIKVSDHDPLTLDMHPIVREYFADDWSRADRPAVLAGHRRLYEYHRARVPAEPASADQFERLFLAVGQGLQGGLYEEAYELYRQAVAHRGVSLLPSEHGLIGLELSALAGFFAKRWSSLVCELPCAARVDILRRVAECLQAMGRVAEAEEPLLECLAFEQDGADEGTAAETAHRLSTVYLVLGDLPRARHYSRVSVAHFAGRHPDRRMVYSLCRHGDILQLMGERSEAEATLERAEALNAQIDPDHPARHGVESFWMCDLLIMQVQESLFAAGHDRPDVEGLLARLDEVRRRAMLAIASDLEDAFLVALHHICIGRAAMLQALLGRRHRLADAGEALDRGVNDLRQSGQQHWLPRGLLARAAFRRESGRLAEAEADILEARKIAEKRRMTPMRLHIADCLIEHARVALAKGDLGAAAEHCRDARLLVDTMRYHSRDSALSAVEAQLS